MTVLEMTKDIPAFKAFCKRRINGKSKTIEQILAENSKATNADIRKFMKRRGLLSVLKENEYLTSCGDVSVQARLEKRGDEFTSVIIYDSRDDVAEVEEAA